MGDASERVTISSDIACHFPQLIGPSQSQDKTIEDRRFSRVQLGSLKSGPLGSFDAEFSSWVQVTQLAWAVVLRAYIGTKSDVGFTGIELAADRWSLTHKVINQSLFEKTGQAAADSLRRSQGLDDGLTWNDTQSAELNNTAVLTFAESDGSLTPELEAIVAQLESLKHIQLVCCIVPKNGSVQGQLYFKNHWIGSGYAAAIAHAFTTAFSVIRSSPSEPLSRISTCGPDHERQIRMWNDTRLERWNCKLHELFEATRQQFPGNVAVHSYEGEMTYTQLGRLSDKVASAILESGTQPGDLVGHFFALSAYAIVATLAIFKAGCVSVPITSMDPRQRWLYMLQSAKVKAILTDDIEQDPDLEEMRVPIIRLNPQNLQQLPDASSFTPPQVDSSIDAAVVCFTSGSTGRPKGVIQTHSGLATQCRALARRQRVTSSSRLSNLHPYIFDVSHQEIFTALYAGAALCIPQRADMLLPKPLEVGKALSAFSITHAVMSPTMIGTMELEQIPQMEVLMAMGEAVNRQLVSKWGGLSKPEFVTGYGSTEGILYQTFTPAFQPQDNPLDNGPAFANTCRVWITDIDDPNHLLPVGAVGEVLVESPILAAGYLYDDAKTTEKFITSPDWLSFGVADSHRVYRTGDLGRYGPGGSLVFVGRKDTQINFYGERIELGEIDYHLNHLNLPGVSDIFSDFLVNRDVLVAFICMPREETALNGSEGKSEDVTANPSVTEIWEMSDAAIDQVRSVLKDSRRRLLEQMPPWWIPTMYFPIFSSARPVTTTGKTNRKMLRDWIERASKEDLARFESLDEEADVEDVSMVDTVA